MPKALENDLLRLQHMLDAAQHASRFARGKTQQDLHDDMQLLSALAYQLQIIGEAACHISSSLQVEHAEIAWNDITGMRHWLAHAYYRIDLAVIWQTVDEDLPLLIRQLNNILTDMNRQHNDTRDE